MELLLSWITGGASGLISLALLCVILNPRVHEGIVIKSGLICMCAGWGAIALRLVDGAGAESQSLLRALMLVISGIGVVFVGYVLRKARHHRPARRSTDWTDLLDAHPSETPR